MNDRNDLGMFARAHGALCSKQGALASVLMLSPLAAFAQETGVDTTAITAKITENTGKAVAIAALFIGGVWALKSMGLFKRG